MKKEFDFLRAHQAGGRAGKGKGARPKKLVVIVVAANVVVAVAVCGYLLVQSRMLESQRADLSAYLTTSTQAERYGEIVAVQGELAAIRTYNTQVSEGTGIVQGLPDLTAGLCRVLTTNMSGNMRLVEMGFSQGVLTATFSMPNSSGVPDYVERVKISGSFLEVSYDGWLETVTSSTMTDAEGVDTVLESSDYRLVMRCVLPREEVAADEE